MDYKGTAARIDDGTALKTFDKSSASTAFVFVDQFSVRGKHKNRNWFNQKKITI